MSKFQTSRFNCVASERNAFLHTRGISRTTLDRRKLDKTTATARYSHKCKISFHICPTASVQGSTYVVRVLGQVQPCGHTLICGANIWKLPPKLYSMSKTHDHTKYDYIYIIQAPVVITKFYVQISISSTTEFSGFTFQFNLDLDII